MRALVDIGCRVALGGCRPSKNFSSRSASLMVELRDIDDGIGFLLVELQLIHLSSGGRFLDGEYKKIKGVMNSLSCKFRREDYKICSVVIFMTIQFL